MRVHLNKKLLKGVAMICFAAVVILLFLKVISIWDNTHGRIDPETIQPTAPLGEVQSKAPNVFVREPTDEERASLANGSIARDELIQDLVEDAVAILPDTTTGEEEANPPSDAVQTDLEQIALSGQPVQTEYERRIAEIIAEVYVLREEYIVALENMYVEAESTLLALSNEDNGEGAISSMVSNYLSKATELELQCDQRMDAIVMEMEGLIRENNGDVSLVDTVIDTYANEKHLKKEWYISKLEERGLI